ncbi:MAG: hypothetical protein ACYCOU_01260 [Sulfobacillus sp.]
MAALIQMYCSPTDVEIDRTHKPGVVTLRIGDGDELFYFPGEWSDAQIQTALGFANTTYAQGLKIGRWEKLKEVRAALGLPAQGVDE